MARASLFLIAASTAALIAACSEPESEAPATAAVAAGAESMSGINHGGMNHTDMNHGEMAGGDMQAGMDHGDMDHGTMSGGMAAVEASAEGMLNAVDQGAASVNITHPPMPEINWPEMTMDIPVTGTVDLSELSEGDTVRFTVRRGRDDVFRIVEMTPTEAGE
ncbi:Copper binding protein CusF [Oceanicaulis sp. 350]|nr:Copper binding protein CusF [Oceanicaulis sp. 350]